MLNTILGERYEIIEEIGKGGMAYVYKARCILLDRIVAIKVLRDDLGSGEEFLKRFNKEAQAAASLTHPNIVSIFDFGVDKGMHYIVMEYVDGITLKEYIAQNKKLSYTEALDITYQIADALSAAHEKRIVHRDIKPHNILITPDRNVKVTDFGIARFGTANTLSTGDDILGSVHYISPEQARGESVDNRSDLYSLGISLYEMISGSVPFDADTPVAVAMMQIKEEAKPISFENDDVLPLGVQQIILKSISKQTEKRYQNADEFKDDILNILENAEYTLADEGEYYSVDSILTCGNGRYGRKSSLSIKKGKKIVLTFLAAITALLLVLSFYIVTNETIMNSLKNDIFSVLTPVPSLTGKTLAESQNLCKEAGFDIVVKEEVDAPDANPGTVVSQHPVSGEKARKGTVINVTLNKVQNSLLENFAGKKYKEAQNLLEKEGFSVNLIFEESKSDEDTVLRQSPSPGSKPRKNAVITLYVSAGMLQNENFVTVPTLVGNTYEKALSLLTGCELTTGTITGVTEPHDDDTIVSQAIPAGSLVIKQSGVGMTVKCPHADMSSENDEAKQHEQNGENNNDNDDKMTGETDNG